MTPERRLVWSLAWRFVRGKRSRLLAGTTWAALLATAIGVMAMVIAMALMTGYREDLRKKLVQGSAAIIAYPLGDRDSAALMKAQERLEGIEGVSEARVVLYGVGSLASEAAPDGGEVMLRGVDGDSGLEELCSLELVEEAPGGGGLVSLVVGRELYDSLEVEAGEPLRLMAIGFERGRPRFRYRSARVAAICSTGFSEFDREWVLLDRGVLSELLGTDSTGPVLEVGLEDLDLIDEVRPLIKSSVGEEFLLSDFLDRNRELFTALRIQQFMLFLVLGLIVFVSTFNTASSLVVMVRERRRDLGVLQALGLPPSEQRKIFLRYGAILGTTGTTLGLALGAVTAWALDAFELIRFDTDVAAIYFISSVPFRVLPFDLALIGAFTILVTLAACWFPTRNPEDVSPSEALRAE